MSGALRAAMWIVVSLAWLAFLAAVLVSTGHGTDHLIGNVECEPPCIAQEQQPKTILVPVRLGPAPSISR